MVSAEDVHKIADGLTVGTLLRRNATEHADLPALTSGIGADARTWTWSELRADTAAVARGLEGLGLATGDRMMIMMATRQEHWIADLGAMTLGAIPCTAYATLSTEQIRFVARQSAAKVVVLDGADQLRRWLPVLDDLPALRRVVVVDEQSIPDGDGRFVSYRELLADGRAAHEKDPAVFERLTDARKPQDPLCMLYTSGTTGDPKGVVISHHNVIWECAGLDLLLPIDEPHPRTISYLPLAHIAERALSFYMLLYQVGHCTICPDQSQLLATLCAVRPHGLFGVPRVWEKLAAGVATRLSALPDERRTVIEGARQVAIEVFRRRADGEEVPAELVERFATANEHVLRPIRALLGLDETVRTNSGAAALPAATLEYLASLGITVLEVWGLSETTGAVTTSLPDAFRPGAVGLPAPGMELRLAEDGEIFVRGPVVFLGYLADDGTVSPATDHDGWFGTGDIGEVDEDGLLRITDRKKELIITSGGKNVAPTKVEGVLRGHPLIGQAAVIGDGRPCITALLSLDEDAAPAWARANGLDTVELAELAEHPAVRAALDAAVEQANNDLARAEQVKCYHVLAKPWTAESGELTPTLKLRRRIISERYADEIERLYRRQD
jgi:long-chain acyl-CoA synthetase